MKQLRELILADVYVLRTIEEEAGSMSLISLVRENMSRPRRVISRFAHSPFGRLATNLPLEKKVLVDPHQD